MSTEERDKIANAVLAYAVDEGLSTLGTVQAAVSAGWDARGQVTPDRAELRRLIENSDLSADGLAAAILALFKNPEPAEKLNTEKGNE